MDDWERAFRIKSARRRSRERWRDIVNGGFALLIVVALVAGGLGIADLLLDIF